MSCSHIGRYQGGRAAPIVVALCLAVLAGCASVSFKRGASGDAIGSDERACRAETTSESAYAECMKKRGLYVTGSGGAAAAPPTKAVATPSPSIPVVRETTRSLPAAPAAPDAPTPVPVAPVAIETPSPTVVPADPNERIKVSSWWKLGASPGDLDRAIAACVTTLGPAHRPDAAATVVTVALRDCLRAGGWYAVGTSAAE